MSDSLVPRSSDPAVAPVEYRADFGMAADGAPGPAKNPLERPLAAIRRYKWLMLAVALTGAGLGFLGLQFLTPEFQVPATIWLQTETPQSSRSGPIRSGELLNSSAWTELFRSYKVVDAVVRKLTLFVRPEDPADAPLFAGFELADRVAFGAYFLELDGPSRKWNLRLQTGAVVDQGAAGDSVGRKLGFEWKLPSNAFSRSDVRRVRFTVLPPREVAQDLRNHLDTRLPPGSNFLSLTFRGPDPEVAANVLNTWLAEFVDVAADLKKRNVVDFAKILQNQLEYADSNLVNAQRALENFRVQTITLPAEAGPAAAGVELTRDPVMASFFEQRAEFDNLRHDREAVEKTLVAAAAGTVPYEAILAIPSVDKSPLAVELRVAFKDLADARAERNRKQAVFTDSVAEMRDIAMKIATLERATIPAIADKILISLRERENDYQTRIAGAAKELKSIPPRTIKEMSLTRAVNVAQSLYITLKGSFAEAQLAEASASPDVRIHDPAVAPLTPSRNTKPRIMLMAVFGGLGAALVLAILLDKLDPKFRYPDQAPSELGLGVAGIVPRLPKGGINPNSPDQVMQLVEAFRSLRMHVMHSVSEPAVVAVTSAAPGDGKSLVAANLAMSFAEAGMKTLLVDGDTRRGALHDLFAAAARPGLTEYLADKQPIEAIVQQTSHENLHLLPSGARNVRSPEMLGGNRLLTLVKSLHASYDVIIFDTPPLAAGIDAYAIAAAAGNLLMVVRIGKTERRLAAAKLAIADRLPINVIGTVLNGVDLRGEFQYYGYSPGYHIEEPKGELAAASG